MFNPKLTLEQQRQELAKLLVPISAEAPVGANIRLDSNRRDEIRGIESLFRDALNAERKQEQFRLFPSDSPPNEPNWGQFIDQALDYLSKTSKDLLLATLVAEAALREYGIRGFLLSVELMTGLVDAYWPDVFPSQDPEATSDHRFSAWKHAYDWLDRVAPRLDTLTKLTANGTTFAEYAEAVKLDDPQLPSSAREDRIRKGAKTTDVIQAEIRQKEAYFKTLFSDLTECKAALEKLAAVAQQKCVSPDPAVMIPVPDFSRMIDGVKKMTGSAREIGGPGLLPETDDPNKAAESSDGSDSSEENGQPATTVGKSSSGQMTREAAFSQLKQLATFFRRTEPHSPISYAIEQAVRWGNMPLPELLTELIADSGSRKNLFERTGLPIPSDSESE